LVKWDKEGHIILTKVKYIKGNNCYFLYVPNVSPPNFIKHTLKDIKAHIESNTVVVGNFNIPLSPIDRSSKQKNHQRNPRNKWHHKSNRLNWQLQNISSNNNTIHILLHSPWNFLQNRSYLRAQSKPQQI
jgi:hypothetical protein